MAHYCTPKELEVLTWIKNYIKKHDYAPTQLEIGEAFNFPRPTAQYFVDQLEKKEKLTTNGRTRRNIRLI